MPSADESERPVFCFFRPFPILWSVARTWTGAPDNDRRCY